MAISATINKISLNITDMDRHYYKSHELTVAQHPSENDFRCMIRIIAFAINASKQLIFTKGLSSENEPDLWAKTLSNDIELWIDLGQPDEKRIRKACGRADQVIIYTYHEGKARVWWEKQQANLARFSNLGIFQIYAEGAENLIKRL